MISTVLLLLMGSLLVDTNVNVDICVDAYVLVVSNTNPKTAGGSIGGIGSRTAFAFAARPGTMRTFASTSTSTIRSTVRSTTTSTTILKNNANDNDTDNDNDNHGATNEEETFAPTRNNGNDNNDDSNGDAIEGGHHYEYLDDLTPPPVNFARNSILFSDNPSTRLRNNSALDAWRFARTHLPAIATGAWPWRDAAASDRQPLAALYNAAFVRLPVLAVAASYLYQKIAEHHDLVMDFGGGPRAIPPVLVLAVLVLILL